MAKYTVHTARFLRHVWPFYNIMHARVKEKLVANFIFIFFSDPFLTVLFKVTHFNIQEK